ncbi:E3 ubiquitin-protein ligase Ufd4-like [Acropora millepora]|uniref:E3 ubiquitin-protein ligase Ufd4-like n=1 Tax=Acropora millepora TaxID=45264 RepID=UPI001CF12431|nr:E3 ubiquitin-protein ligase Ufd4-like [Acropora millepora]
MDGEKRELEQKLEDERARHRDLKLSMRNFNKEKGEQELKIKRLQRKNAELEKATVQTSEFEKKSEKNKKTTKEEEDYREQTETKVKTELQAQVDELKNKLKNQSKRMSEQEKHFNKVINAAKSKSDALEEEPKALQIYACVSAFICSFLLCPIETGTHNYRTDFDKRGVIYTLANNFGRTNSSSTGITATRSSDSKGEAKDILRNQVQRPNGLVCATKARINSWWCVDLTENYALYLTHYTLRHGQEQSGSVLRNWELQGSLDGEEWTTLKTHENDQGLQESKSYCTCTWPIEGKSNAFRYFKILQTGKNSTGNLGIFLSGIELYGVLIETGLNVSTDLPKSANDGKVRSVP